MKKHIIAYSLAVIALLPFCGQAATITIDKIYQSTTAPTNVNLTTLGTTDWVLWNGTSGSNAVLYNDLNGGTAIGTASISGADGGTRAADAPSGITFDYTNGTNPPAVTETGVNTWAGQRVGDNQNPDGIWTINTILPGAEGTMDLWFSAFRASSWSLTAAIASDSAINSEGGTMNAFAPTYSQYRVTFSGATGGDTLALTYQIDGNDYDSSMSIHAAALSVIPEPSSIALIGLALASLILIRRRK